MDEFLENSVFELKRADFLIFVSLKYSAVVEIMRNGLSRLIDSMSHIIDGYLHDLENENKIMEVPENTIAKVKLLKTNCVQIEDYLDFYLFLKKLMKSDFTKDGEFRKRLKMTAKVMENNQGEIVEVDIDTLKKYYKKTQDFVDSYKQLKSSDE